MILFGPIKRTYIYRVRSYTSLLLSHSLANEPME